MDLNVFVIRIGKSVSPGNISMESNVNTIKTNAQKAQSGKIINVFLMVQNVQMEPIKNMENVFLFHSFVLYLATMIDIRVHANVPQIYALQAPIFLIISVKDNAFHMKNAHKAKYFLNRAFNVFAQTLIATIIMVKDV